MTAGAVTLTLGVVVLVRAITGAGPGLGEASPLAAQREIEDAIRRSKQRLLEQRPAEAEKIIRDALDRRPKDADLRVALAETLLVLNQPAAAYAEFNEAIGLRKDDADLHHAAGTVASVAGLVDRAEGHYRIAQTMAPGNPKYALSLGLMERKLGRLDDARATLLRAVKLEPGLAVAWGALADLSLEENNLEMAGHYVAKALEIQPDSPNWLLIQARLLRRQGEPERAAVMLAAISDAIGAPDAMILRERALCLGMLGRGAEAATLYAEACRVGHPDRVTLAELNYEAAVWHERVGETASAEDFARRALELGEGRAARLLERLSSAG